MSLSVPDRSQAARLGGSPATAERRKRESSELRLALSRFASGVTIVTVRAGDRVHGLTVSAFASVSLEPPLVAVMIDGKHSAHRLLARPEAVFAVNILAQEQVELSNRFAWLKDGDRFALGDWGTAATGAPILRDAAAWLDCRVYETKRAGTHSIFVGEVAATCVPDPETQPLLYWNRQYRQLQVCE